MRTLNISLEEFRELFFLQYADGFELYAANRYRLPLYDAYRVVVCKAIAEYEGREKK